MEDRYRLTFGGGRGRRGRTAGLGGDREPDRRRLVTASTWSWPRANPVTFRQALYDAYFVDRPEISGGGAGPRAAAGRPGRGRRRGGGSRRPAAPRGPSPPRRPKPPPRSRCRTSRAPRRPRRGRRAWSPPSRPRRRRRCCSAIPGRSTCRAAIRCCCPSSTGRRRWIGPCSSTQIPIRPTRWRRRGSRTPPARAFRRGC